MRVLYVIDSLGASGTEHSTAALLPVLRERGHDVSVSTLYDAGFGDEERARDSGFDVRPLASGNYLGRLRELRRRIAEPAPDVVHCALFTSDMVGRVAAWRTGAAVVSSLVSTPYVPARIEAADASRWKVRSVQAADAVTARLVHRFHAVSSGVAEANAAALRINPARITVVERGRSRRALGCWSAGRRADARRRIGLPPDAKVVLSIGRQERVKRHVDVIAAAEAMLGRFPDVRVLIAGRTGSATDELQRALSEHPRVAAITSVLGHRHDVPDLLCAADVLAVASLYEGTAGAAIEAMALRCPVVCTDVEGVGGILHDGVNALLVPPHRPTALADGLTRVLSDDGLADALRDRGLADFEARFTIEVAATRMEALYAELIERRPSVVHR